MKRKRCEDPIPKLPCNVWILIFHRCPLYTLLKLRLVCKDFNHTIRQAPILEPFKHMFTSRFTELEGYFEHYGTLRALVNCAKWIPITARYSAQIRKFIKRRFNEQLFLAMIHANFPWKGYAFQFYHDIYDNKYHAAGYANDDRYPCVSIAMQSRRKQCVPCIWKNSTFTNTSRYACINEIYRAWFHLIHHATVTMSDRQLFFNYSIFKTWWFSPYYGGLEQVLINAGVPPD